MACIDLTQLNENSAISAAPRAAGRSSADSRAISRGRPKALEGLRERARRYTREAIAALVSVIENPRAPAAARIAAANAILDRGWGTPDEYKPEAGSGEPITYVFSWRD